MNELLRAPQKTLDESDTRGATEAVFLLLGSLICYALYGVSAGVFQGGTTVAMAVLKVPLIIIGSVLLCLPSFYVFTAIAGAEYTARQFWTAIAGFCGIAGLILLGLMPIIWLFSVSTTSLGFVLWMHILAWLVALAFGRQFLIRWSRATPARGAIGFWLVLFFLVSLQMTTYLRPVLWRDRNEPLFASAKMSFFVHLHKVTEWSAAQAVTNPPSGGH